MAIDPHNNINRADDRTLLWTVLTLVVLAILAYAAYAAYQSDDYVTYGDRAATVNDTNNATQTE